MILNSHRKSEKCSEQELRQTRRRTQAGLTPGKDDNEVWRNSCRDRLKVSSKDCITEHIIVFSGIETYVLSESMLPAGGPTFCSYRK